MGDDVLSLVVLLLLLLFLCSSMSFHVTGRRMNDATTFCIQVNASRPLNLFLEKSLHKSGWSNKWRSALHFGLELQGTKGLFKEYFISIHLMHESGRILCYNIPFQVMWWRRFQSPSPNHPLQIQIPKTIQQQQQHQQKLGIYNKVLVG